jgi:hypothetical protein
VRSDNPTIAFSPQYLIFLNSVISVVSDISGFSTTFMKPTIYKHSSQTAHLRVKEGYKRYGEITDITDITDRSRTSKNGQRADQARRAK